MGIRDSNHTTAAPRWGIDTGETVDANVAEPPSGQQDTGWVPEVDVPVGEWWNWLHHKAYLRLEYFASLIAKTFNLNAFMRNGKGTTSGQVTAGAGLSVNVALGRAWIQGAMYEAPAVTNLALDTADATHPRFDMIVMDLTGGVPAFAVVIGTPAASPAEPALAADQVVCARVRVNAGAVAPSEIVDRRVFGKQGLAELEVDDLLRAGDVGGSWMLEVDTSSNLVKLVAAGTLQIAGGLITVIQATGQVVFQPITRKYDIAYADFPFQVGVTFTGSPDGWEMDVANSSTLRASVRIPEGCVVTAVRAYGNRATNTPGLTLELHAHNKTTGAETAMASVQNNGTGASGNFVLQDTTISNATIDQDNQYILTVGSIGSGQVTFFGAEVEYTQTEPFKSV